VLSFLYHIRCPSYPIEEQWWQFHGILFDRYLGSTGKLFLKLSSELVLTSDDGGSVRMNFRISKNRGRLLIGYVNLNAFFGKIKAEFTYITKISDSNQE